MGRYCRDCGRYYDIGSFKYATCKECRNRTVVVMTAPSQTQTTYVQQQQPTPVYTPPIQTVYHTPPYQTHIVAPPPPPTYTSYVAPQPYTTSYVAPQPNYSTTTTYTNYPGYY